MHKSRRLQKDLLLRSFRMCHKAGGRAFDLGGPSVYQGDQSLKLSTKAVVFKKSKLVNKGGSAHLAPALICHNPCRFVFHSY